MTTMRFAFMMARIDLDKCVLTLQLGIRYVGCAVTSEDGFKGTNIVIFAGMQSSFNIQCCRSMAPCSEVLAMVGCHNFRCLGLINMFPRWSMLLIFASAFKYLILKDFP